MRRFAYTIPATHAPHGHKIDGGTKAESETDLRTLLAAVYGSRAAAFAEVWEAVDHAADIIEGRMG